MSAGGLSGPWALLIAAGATRARPADVDQQVLEELKAIRALLEKQFP